MGFRLISLVAERTDADMPFLCSFLNDVERIAALNYVPTDGAFLRTYEEQRDTDCRMAF